MPEPGNGGGKNSPQNPKEFSMEKQLRLAFILMAVVMLASPYFFKSAAPPVKKTETAPPKSGTSAPPPPAGTKPEAVAAPARSAASTAAIAAQKEDLFTVDTNVYRVTFSNKGAVVRSWQLKKYLTAGKPLELVNKASTVDFPFALAFKGAAPAELKDALFAAQPDPGGLGISYEFSDGHTVVRKKFQFGRDSYQSRITTEVTQDGKPVPHLIAWRGGFGDAAVANASANTWALRFDATEGKLIKEPAKTAKDGPATFSGTYDFAGLDDTYFTASWLSQAGKHFDVMVFSDSVPSTLDPKPQPFVGAAIGGGATNPFDLFVGPKDVDILRKVNPKLESLVDYGWFTFLAKPLFLALHWTADNLIHNYGWAIVLVTIVINFILFPLRVSSMRSMKKMQALQPQVAAINEKYKGISMRDPRAQDKNAELMDLYKKNGVNPAGGCLPMALQIPFFIAFYKVLSVSIEMRGAKWLWVSDLSTFEQLPIHILPVIMTITQFVQQKMTPTSPGMDPTQQKMMLFMPLMFAVMFYNLPSGVVLYYLTSNLVGIAQQWFFNKTVTPKDLPQPPASTGKKRNGKK